MPPRRLLGLQADLPQERHRRPRRGLRGRYAVVSK
jgi:hypothetical protein